MFAIRVRINLFMTQSISAHVVVVVAALCRNNNANNNINSNSNGKRRRQFYFWISSCFVEHKTKKWESEKQQKSAKCVSSFSSCLIPKLTIRNKTKQNKLLAPKLATRAKLHLNHKVKLRVKVLRNYVSFKSIVSTQSRKQTTVASTLFWVCLDCCYLTATGATAAKTS